ncbi:MAG: hypothetical protein P8010_15425 [Desulfosarcinaceae bacterium]|jgi:hypothetical protein
MRIRALKKQIENLLSCRAEGLETALSEVAALPARQAINPLIGLYCHSDARLRWRAITATGLLVARLADTELASARIIMRRLMWSLNDESGGIGWGAPEAMGEIMARHEILAGEYACILISYLDETGNYLELPALQEGGLWGVGRLAEARSDLLTAVPALLPPFLTAPSPAHRGLAAWVAGSLRAYTLKPLLNPLKADRMHFEFYDGRDPVSRTVGRMASNALAQIDAANPNRK